jgi:hypothetical protein
MKYLLALLIIMPLSSFAEGERTIYDPIYEKLTEFNANDCNNLQLNAKIILPQLYQENKRDTIIQILDYLRARCLNSEFRQMKLLMEIEDGLIPNTWCDSVFTLRVLSSGPRNYDWPYLPYRTRIQTTTLFNTTSDSAFTTFLRQITQNAMEKVDSNSIAYLICRHYLNDTAYIFRRLANHAYQGNCVQTEYDSTVADLRERLNELRIHASVFSGMWVPLGANKSLGNKLELGFQLGGRSKVVGFDITTLMRFMNAKEPYTIIKGDDTGTTKNFWGGYVGADLTLTLLRYGKYDAEIFGGIGYDGFGDGKSDNHSEIPRGMNALSKNIGLTQRLFPSDDRHYFGIQIRYNFINYFSGGGSDLSGNTISVNFLYGVISQPSVRSQLQNLRQPVKRQ